MDWRYYAGAPCICWRALRLQALIGDSVL